MKVSIHPGADRDLTDAFRFYKKHAGAGVAKRLLDEVARVTNLLREYPALGTPTQEDRRFYPLTGYPYSLIYRYRDAEIRLLALRHQHRDPSYGEERS